MRAALPAGAAEQCTVPAQYPRWWQRLLQACMKFKRSCRSRRRWMRWICCAGPACGEPELDMQPLQVEALTLFDAALADLIEMRGREGQRLKELIEQRCATMSELVQQHACDCPKCWRDSVTNSPRGSRTSPWCGARTPGAGDGDSGTETRHRRGDPIGWQATSMKCDKSWRVRNRWVGSWISDAGTGIAKPTRWVPNPARRRDHAHLGRS